MTTTTFAEYFTVEGDRWDTIAVKAYGDPLAFRGIIDANPGLPLRPVFEGGIKILVPVLAGDEEPVADTANLPPWKR